MRTCQMDVESVSIAILRNSSEYVYLDACGVGIEYCLRNSTNMCTWMDVESIDDTSFKIFKKKVYMDWMLEYY